MSANPTRLTLTRTGWIIYGIVEVALFLIANFTAKNASHPGTVSQIFFTAFIVGPGASRHPRSSRNRPAATRGPLTAGARAPATGGPSAQPRAARERAPGSLADKPVLPAPRIRPHRQTPNHPPIRKGRSCSDVPSP